MRTRKFFLAIAMAVITFMSASAFAVHHKVSEIYTYKGNSVYSVKIYNNKSYPIYCILTASNGAYYDGWISSRSWTPWMRINDYEAEFKWKCKSYEF